MSTLRQEKAAREFDLHASQRRVKHLQKELKTLGSKLSVLTEEFESHVVSSRTKDQSGEVSSGLQVENRRLQATVEDLLKDIEMKDTMLRSSQEVTLETQIKLRSAVEFIQTLKHKLIGQCRKILDLEKICIQENVLKVENVNQANRLRLKVGESLDELISAKVKEIVQPQLEAIEILEKEKATLRNDILDLQEENKLFQTDFIIKPEFSRIKDQRNSPGPKLFTQGTLLLDMQEMFENN